MQSAAKTKPEYMEAYKLLCESTYRGVPGILEVDSGNVGTTVGILACTHGNEPAGLGAIQYLLSDLQLSSGRVLFILVNSEAAAHYFRAQTERQKGAARYIDHNMNWIPRDLKAWENSLEGERIKQLLPILQELDGVLDIHSTSSDAPAMLLTCDENGCRASACPSIPFQHIIHDIPRFLSGWFIIELCEKAELKLLAECGQHECPEASSRAIEISISFLAKLGLVQPTVKDALSKQEKKYDYYVKHAVQVPEGRGEYRLVKPIAPFEKIEHGQVIACCDTEELVNQYEGYAIMCPSTDGPLCSKEALLFICDRQRV